MLIPIVQAAIAEVLAQMNAFHPNSAASEQDDITKLMKDMRIGEQSLSAATMEGRNNSTILAVPKSETMTQGTKMAAKTEIPEVDIAILDSQLLDAKVLDTAIMDLNQATIAEVLQTALQTNNSRATSSSELEVEKMVIRRRRENMGGILRSGLKTKTEVEKVRFEEDDAVILVATFEGFSKAGEW